MQGQEPATTTVEAQSTKILDNQGHNHSINTSVCCGVHTTTNLGCHHNNITNATTT
jgi:hypothetical protein